jgi:anti-sigma factor (TIGR02949 family)
MSPQDETMHCEDALDLLEAMIDGDLTEERAATLRRHLDRCRGCSREFDHAQQTVIALRSLPEFDAPDRIVRRARAEIGRTRIGTGAPIFGVRRSLWLAAAAVVALSLAGSMMIGRHRAAPTADPDAAKAAAEVKLALATLGDISRRAELMVKHRVVDERVVPTTLRGLTGALRLADSDSTNHDPESGAGDITIEGSS